MVGVGLETLHSKERSRELSNLMAEGLSKLGSIEWSTELCNLISVVLSVLDSMELSTASQKFRKVIKRSDLKDHFLFSTIYLSESQFCLATILPANHD